jgi:hypothetical protein
MEQVLEEENKMLHLDIEDRKQIINDNNTTIGKIFIYISGSELLGNFRTKTSKKH